MDESCEPDPPMASATQVVFGPVRQFAAENPVLVFLFMFFILCWLILGFMAAIIFIIILVVIAIVKCA